MSLPNRSTKLKVAFGYILLTALLFISIGYIYQEMKSLSGTGDDEAINWVSFFIRTHFLFHSSRLCPCNFLFF